MAAISWKLAGNSLCRAARDTMTRPDSIGWRRVSSACRDHSASSSRKSTPLCASETSPGRGLPPPPISATALARWCGLLYGRCRQRERSRPWPLTEWMAAVSSASVSSGSGSSPGRREASRVLPQPGGPMKSNACAPAAATSSARRAAACPRTSARSGYRGVASARSSMLASGSVASPRRCAQTSSRVRATYARPPLARAASAPLPAGTTSGRPSRAAARAAGSTPSTGFSSPVSASSPSSSTSPSACTGTWPLAASRPSAMARS